ncbi:hypothetical protein J3A83DRAFT_1998099 [Scleroderma citrinum]
MAAMVVQTFMGWRRCKPWMAIVLSPCPYKLWVSIFIATAAVTVHGGHRRRHRLQGCHVAIRHAAPHRYRRGATTAEVMHRHGGGVLVALVVDAVVITWCNNNRTEKHNYIGFWPGQMTCCSNLSNNMNSFSASGYSSSVIPPIVLVIRSIGKHFSVSNKRLCKGAERCRMVQFGG